MTEHLIKPAGAVVRIIEIQYYINKDGSNGLLGFRLEDKDAKTLLHSCQ